MAKRKGGGRFSKSGHISYAQAAPHPAAPNASYDGAPFDHENPPTTRSYGEPSRDELRTERIPLPEAFGAAGWGAACA